MTQTLTTEQLRARAKFWREKAVEAKWESVSIAQDMLQNADAFDELAANREAQPVAFPAPKDKSQGWKIDPEYLHSIADAVGSSDDEGAPSMELVEAVLLAAAPPAPTVPPGYRLQPISEYDAMCEYVRDAPPAPAVPDDLVAAVNLLLDCDGTRGHFSAIRCGDAREEVERLLAQPVSQGYTLPDGWIACSERLPEIGERDWRTALPVLVKCEIGVIPAYYGFTYHEGEQHFGFMESVKFGDASGSSPEQYENRLMMHVTHWMPLPAAPEGGN